MRRGNTLVDEFRFRIVADRIRVKKCARVCVRPALRVRVQSARVSANVDASAGASVGVARARVQGWRRGVCEEVCITVGRIQLYDAGERIHRVGSYERRTSGGTRTRDEG